MKNNTARRVESRKSKVESRPDVVRLFFHPRPSTLGPRPAFTLVELLVVISIIGILAGFTIPALKAFKRTAVINQTKAEMAQLETAIDSFKAAYGFYPPTGTNVLISPLYYELIGTTNNTSTGFYETLDGSVQIKPGDVPTAFPFLRGFVNCMKPGAGEDAPVARSFISGLRPNRFMSVSNVGVAVTVLVAAVGGPDDSYKPFFNTTGFNPWRYVCPGVNNPNSYDLWIQLSIGGKTNLICNWSSQVTFNSPLP